MMTIWITIVMTIWITIGMKEAKPAEPPPLTSGPRSQEIDNYHRCQSRL